MEYRGPDHLIAAWGRGDRESLDELIGLIYHELHGMAAGILRGEGATNRTRPTSLVNDLYLELQRQGRLEARGQKHFFSIAAYLMRQILVQSARKRAAQKRGGAGEVAPIQEWSMEAPVQWEQQPETMLALHAALERLAEFDPLKASIVEMRFFADLSIEDTARALELSPMTVKRHWAVARVWLYEQLRP